MRYIESTLVYHGYEVINVNYPSTKYNFSHLADIVWNDIKQNICNHKVHFIGYSMGGLLVRTILNKYEPKHLGRVILIGAPINGSEIADLFHDNFFYKKLIGPAGQEIRTLDNVSKELNKNNYELGCIASTLNGIWKIIYPISYFLLPEKNDGIVSLTSTQINGIKNSIVISCAHFFLPFSKKVNNHIVSFLKTGNFNAR